MRVNLIMKAFDTEIGGRADREGATWEAGPAAHQHRALASQMSPFSLTVDASDEQVRGALGSRSAPRCSGRAGLQIQWGHLADATEPRCPAPQRGTPDPTPKRSTRLARWRTLGVRKPTPTAVAIKVGRLRPGIGLSSTQLSASLGIRLLPA
jgi:hypothetical protein